MFKYARNPFHGMPDMAEEEIAWDILYERYCSQTNLGLSDTQFIYHIPTFKDATKYAALKRELKRSIEEIQVTTRYSVLDKIFMIRSLSLVFEENIKKIGCDEVIDEI